MKNLIAILTFTIFTTISANIATASDNSTTHFMQWFGNNNFSFNENGNSLSVTINKKPWESFTLKVNKVDLTENPVLRFKISTELSISLRLEISNGIFMSDHSSSHLFNITGNSFLSEIICDFSNDINSFGNEGDAFVVFYINPGQAFSGKINIDNVNLTETNGTDSGINAIENALNVFPIPATDNVNATMPDASYNTIAIFDLSGKLILEKNISAFDNNTVKISTSEIPRGTYILKAFGNQRTLESKIILN